MKNQELSEKIEKKFQEIGGFTWKQAEIWAGFCDSVGMDPMPFLKVMLNNICDVKSVSRGKSVPASANSPELWVVCKCSRTSFKLIGTE